MGARSTLLALLVLAPALARAQQSSPAARIVNYGVNLCNDEKGYNLILAMLARAGHRAGDVRVEIVRDADIIDSSPRKKKLLADFEYDAGAATTRPAGYNKPSESDLQEMTRLILLESMYEGSQIARALEYPKAVAAHRTLPDLTQGNCGMTAFIIGHELAHLERDDVAQGRREFERLVRLRTPAPHIAAIMAPMIQRQEREADLRGLELIRAAGIAEDAAVRFFKRWDELHPAQRSGNHGTGADRCRNLGLPDC